MDRFAPSHATRRDSFSLGSSFCIARRQPVANRRIKKARWTSTSHSIAKRLNGGRIGPASSHSITIDALLIVNAVSISDCLKMTHLYIWHLAYLRWVFGVHANVGLRQHRYEQVDHSDGCHKPVDRHHPPAESLRPDGRRTCLLWVQLLSSTACLR